MRNFLLHYKGADGTGLFYDEEYKEYVRIDKKMNEIYTIQRSYIAQWESLGFKQEELQLAGIVDAKSGKEMSRPFLGFKHVYTKFE